jgi:tRNA threonylcarbamoyladenosine biosynthesis protein TsaB
MSNNLLYIDTSAHKATYMLVNEHEIVSHKYHEVQNEHGQTINRLLQELLQESALTFADLKGVVVLNGPGSYTGLRISLSSAKGICYAHDIPLLLINKLNLINAHASDLARTKTILIPARENEYYSATYNKKNECLLAPNLLNSLEVSNLTKQYDSVLISDISICDSLFKTDIIITYELSTIFQVINNTYLLDKEANLFDSEPFYLKNVYFNK